MRLARRGIPLALVVIFVLLAVAGSAFAVQPKHGCGHAAKPSRVLIITFDQMRPEYAQQYHMTNFLGLQKTGVNFNKAYVGDMAAETVVSHNVIASGLFPKHMGWSDEVMRDVDNVLGKGAGAIFTVGDLSYDQFQALEDHYAYPKLGDYMHSAFPGSKVAYFGEKGYQVKSMAAGNADYWMDFSGKYSTPTDGTNTLPWSGKYRMPEACFTDVGAVPYNNVPSYILNDDRFKISSGNSGDKYGTDVTAPAYLYPEDGRYAPGPYADHRSGDAWVADAAIKFIDNEPNWASIHLNFGGIDKIGHMWGGPPSDTVAWEPGNLLTEVHMAFMAKNADDQLGKLIAELQAKGEWDQTLVVLLADHGSTSATATANQHFVNAAGGGDMSWYYDPNGTCVNTTYGRAGANNASVLAPLNDNGNLAYSYQSTAIESWLIDQSWAMKLHTANVMKGMPDVLATYVRVGDHYVLVAKNKGTCAENSWWLVHGQELVDTMAWAGAADVVGLLKDHTSYGVYGDHGGAQQDVQRIPMVFWAKGIRPAVKGTEFRLADVLPTVLRNMGIAQTARTDGVAYDLNIK
jgi:arylsulfatase A-like enzyme